MPVHKPADRPGKQPEELPQTLSSPAPLIEFARQVGFVALAILLYFGVRGLTQGDVDVAIQNGLDVLAFERRVGLDLERWSQDVTADHAWLVTAANWVYIWGHWPVIAATLIWLHRTHRAHYLLLRNGMFISGAIGLVIFATYAVAPPRLLDVGLIDTVTEQSNSYRILQPPALVNKYAAVPSLHVGWNLLVGIFLLRTTRSRAVHIFAVASPILMAIAVVVTANHYVIDGILGCALALLGLALAVPVTPRLASFDAWIRQRLTGREPVGRSTKTPRPPPTGQSAGRLVDRPPDPPSARASRSAPTNVAG